MTARPGRIFLAAILLFSCPAVLAQPGKRKEDAALRKAADIFTSGECEKAVEAYRWFIKNFPNSGELARAYYGLGWSYSRCGDSRKALASFGRIKKYYPGHGLVPDVIVAIGDVHFSAKAWDKAEEAYKEVLTKYGKRPAAKAAEYGLARVLMAKGETDKAMTALNKFMKENPNNEVALAAMLEVAWIQQQGGHHDAAIEGFQAVITRGDWVQRNMAHYYLGDSLFETRKLDEALKEYRIVEGKEGRVRVLKTEIEKLKAAGVAALREMDKNEYDRIHVQEQEVQRELASVTGSEDFGSSALYGIQQCYLNTEQYYEVKVILELIKRQYPESKAAAAAQYIGAVASAQLGQTEACAAELKAFVAAYPGHELEGDATVLLGRCMSVEGDPDEARRILENVDRDGKAGRRNR